MSVWPIPEGSYQVALEEIFSCYLDRAWLWAHGHIPKTKFKGECLSGLHRHSFDADYEKEVIIHAKVVHGWVLSVTGDLSGCGWDSTTWFQTEEPVIVNGVWDFAGLGVDGQEAVAHVVDGPHLATWLEIGERV